MYIEILDENDNCPEFEMETLSGQISSQDVFVVTNDNLRLVLAATDSDIVSMIYFNKVEIYILLNS